MTALGGDVARAKLAATLLLTLPGLPFVYYGEEIGMTGDKPDPRLRTPMQWAARPGARLHDRHALGGRAERFVHDHRGVGGTRSGLAAEPLPAPDPPAPAERGAGDRRPRAARGRQSPGGRLPASLGRPRGAGGGESRRSRLRRRARLRCRRARDAGRTPRGTCSAARTGRRSGSARTDESPATSRPRRSGRGSTSSSTSSAGSQAPGHARAPRTKLRRAAPAPARHRPEA